MMAETKKKKIKVVTSSLPHTLYPETEEVKKLQLQNYASISRNTHTYIFNGIIFKKYGNNQIK